MADNHRNYQGDYTNNENRSRQDRDWENRGNKNYRSDEDFENYRNENQDYGYGSSRYGQGNEGNFGDKGNQYNQRERGSNRYDREHNYGYGGREYGSSYGGGLYQGNSSYYDSGNSRNERPSYGNSRNLYDRDYEGFNRGFNSGYSGLGGANYSGYDDRRRGYDENRGSGSNRNFGGNYYGSGRSNYGQGDSNERSWWDRTRDEVSSWFGDDDAERRRERDRQINHRGKGPRNYTRSDDRIKDDINDRLSDDPWVDASDIEVTVNSGEVTLTGTINERSEKRRAEDIAEEISGVKHVENRLRVGKREGSTIGTGSSIGTGSYGSSTETSAVSSAGATNAASEKSKSKSGYITG